MRSLEQRRLGKLLVVLFKSLKLNGPKYISDHFTVKEETIITQEWLHIFIAIISIISREIHIWKGPLILLKCMLKIGKAACIIQIIALHVGLGVYMTAL